MWQENVGEIDKKIDLLCTLVYNGITHKLEIALLFIVIWVIH